MAYSIIVYQALYKICRKISNKAKKKILSLTSLRFRAKFGEIIRRGILAQIFATGAAKVRHYQVGSSYQREAWVLGTSSLIYLHFYGGG